MADPGIPEDFVEFLKVLNRHKVDYLVVGGHAVGHHGFPRDTGDMDILIKKTEENACRVMRAVADFGLGRLGFTKEDYLSGDFIQFGIAPVRIDVTSAFEGVAGEDVWLGAVPGKIGGVSVRFPSREDLLANKKAAGRPKDLRDVEALEAGVKRPRRRQAKGAKRPR